MTDVRDDPAAGDTKAKQKPGHALRETVLLLGFAILLALVVKTFFVQSFYIPSESMEPGLEVNDRILVQKPSYWFGGEPQRGDVIVFDDPGGWLNGLERGPRLSLLARAMAKIGLYPTGGHLVKRVVGVEGDVIECCDAERRITVNGTPIEEDGFIEPQKRCDGPMALNCDWTAGPVPKDSLFVMGDNRNNSGDSRIFGPVSLENFKGKAFLRFWPVSRIGSF